ncbi:hypothetical protein A3J15_00195 [Candidatus Roizmanbacteria bacterium RIFCSPLOWO2_02_FULL_38_10]|uniref:NAD-dependent epimerase/dehydratase domain-containing protein n=1 Tax=Candidatus Roizmanbacteria bacterium RIFCSPLOWO2_02_FULL_38_10 TaxID=1802074 RepID=A0A1F7JNH2_9BACT|nr:MAG: hypothetical protein A3J15_00195 [Candidatus Roizmanbacteria bacterium RIFCSPLOWO2_02_FULL_38_10]
MAIKKKVLITGGAGFIGSHLAEAFITRGYRVYALDIDINPYSYFAQCSIVQKATYIKQNICHFDSLSLVFSKIKPDFVYHLAAVSEVLRASDNPQLMYETNIQGTVNVLEAARQTSTITGIIVASSDKAYGAQGRKKYRETTPLLPTQPYEISKAAADMISLGYAKSYVLPVAVSRFGNVYGEGDFHLSRLIPDMIRSCLENKILHIRSDGKFVRDYLYVKDVVSGYIKLAENIEKAKGLAFNFGSKDTLSVLQVIQICEKALNKKIKYKILNTAKSEIPYQSLNYSKAKKVLNWTPNYQIKKQIKNIYDWYDRR